MTTERFRDLLNAEPFEKFTIHLADGPAFTVHHPEFVARSASGRTAVVRQPDESMNTGGTRNIVRQVMAEHVDDAALESDDAELRRVLAMIRR